jgi:polyhydroxyalkanoate synthesis regulator phasin
MEEIIKNLEKAKKLIDKKGELTGPQREIRHHVEDAIEEAEIIFGGLIPKELNLLRKIIQDLEHVRDTPQSLFKSDRIKTAIRELRELKKIEFFAASKT